MSYATGEAAALAVLTSLAQFSATNAQSFANKSKEDLYAILDKGKSDHYAFLRRGETQETWKTLGLKEVTYTTVVEIWQRMKNPTGTSYQALDQLTSAVLAALRARTHLNDAAVYNAEATRALEPEVARRGRNRHWLVQAIALRWCEVVDPARVD